MEKDFIEIRCKCGKLLATQKNGWIKILGETNYSSNGKESLFVCQKCKKALRIKINNML
ncbi:hypothetical protein [Fusobacterium varium]